MKTSEQSEEARVRRLRENPAEYIALLESLLLEAEDVALSRGSWGLCDCFDRSGSRYQSQTCASVITLVREERTARINTK